MTDEQIMSGMYGWTRPDELVRAAAMGGWTAFAVRSAKDMLRHVCTDPSWLDRPHTGWAPVEADKSVWVALVNVRPGEDDSARDRAHRLAKEVWHVLADRLPSPTGRGRGKLRLAVVRALVERVRASGLLEAADRRDREDAEKAAAARAEAERREAERREAARAEAERREAARAAEAERRKNQFAAMKNEYRQPKLDPRIRACVNFGHWDSLGDGDLDEYIDWIGHQVYGWRWRQAYADRPVWKIDAGDIDNHGGQALIDRILRGPTNWSAKIDGGQGGDLDVTGSIHDCDDEIESWADSGDWEWDRDGGGVTIELSISHPMIEYDVVGRSWSYDILPPVAESEECGTDHEWSSEHCGGCDDNPGVWDIGGGRMKFISRCHRCGMKRTEISLYAHGNSTASAGVPDRTVTYSDPDPDWVREHIGGTHAR